MVKPVRSTQTTPSKSEKVEQEMETLEGGDDNNNVVEKNNNSELVEGKVVIDANLLKKNKKFNQHISTDRPKEVKKTFKTNQKKRKLKGIENALNRIEKDQVFLEKKSKKFATKKKWNALY